MADPPARDASLGRIVGLDAARALAVFGMYYSHVGPWPEETGTWKSFLMEIPHGRSSALFATLAGLSLVLIAGGSRPKSGRPMRQAVVRIAIRSVLLLALGSWLVAMGTSIVVILAYYGLFFLLALPFIKLRARTLAIIAVGVGIGGPLLIQWLWTVDTDLDGRVQREGPARDVERRRPDLAAVQRHVPGPGVDGVHVRGHGDRQTRPHEARDPGAALDHRPGAGPDRLRRRVADREVPARGGHARRPTTEWKAFDQAWSKALEGKDSANWTEEQWKSFDADHASIYELTPADKSTGGSAFDWTGLTSASAHSNMPLELAGNIGVAFTVIAGLVFLLGRFGKLRFWLAPLIAVGSMSLTAYVAHIAAVWYLIDHPVNEVGYTTGWRMWAVFVVVMLAFALLWKRFLKRGPLEYLMLWATKPAKLVR